MLPRAARSAPPEGANFYEWIDAMQKYKKPQIYSLSELPEVQALQKANPGATYDGADVIALYGQAIHVLGMLDTVWPDFEHLDYMSIEVAYIVCNDPNERNYPLRMYRQIAEMLKMMWTIQLEDLYPGGNWTVEIWDDDEMTVGVEIHR